MSIEGATRQLFLERSQPSFDYSGPSVHFFTPNFDEANNQAMNCCKKIAVDNKWTMMKNPFEQEDFDPSAPLKIKYLDDAFNYKFSKEVDSKNRCIAGLLLYKCKRELTGKDLDTIKNILNERLKEINEYLRGKDADHRIIEVSDFDLFLNEIDDSLKEKGGFQAEYRKFNFAVFGVLNLDNIVKYIAKSPDVKMVIGIVEKEVFDALNGIQGWVMKKTHDLVLDIELPRKRFVVERPESKKEAGHMRRLSLLTVQTNKIALNEKPVPCRIITWNEHPLDAYVQLENTKNPKSYINIFPDFLSSFHTWFSLKKIPMSDFNKEHLIKYLIENPGLLGIGPEKIFFEHVERLKAAGFDFKSSYPTHEDYEKVKKGQDEKIEKDRFSMYEHAFQVNTLADKKTELARVVIQSRVFDYSEYCKFIDYLNAKGQGVSKVDQETWDQLFAKRDVIEEREIKVAEPASLSIKHVLRIHPEYTIYYYLFSKYLKETSKIDGQKEKINNEHLISWLKIIYPIISFSSHDDLKQFFNYLQNIGYTNLTVIPFEEYQRMNSKIEKDVLSEELQQKFDKAEMNIKEIHKEINSDNLKLWMKENIIPSCEEFILFVRYLINKGYSDLNNIELSDYLENVPKEKIKEGEAAHHYHRKLAIFTSFEMFRFEKKLKQVSYSDEDIIEYLQFYSDQVSQIFSLEIEFTEEDLNRIIGTLQELGIEIISLPTKYKYFDAGLIELFTPELEAASVDFKQYLDTYHKGQEQNQDNLEKWLISYGMSLILEAEPNGGTLRKFIRHLKIEPLENLTQEQYNDLDMKYLCHNIDRLDDDEIDRLLYFANKFSADLYRNYKSTHKDLSEDIMLDTFLSSVREYDKQFMTDDDVFDDFFEKVRVKEEDIDYNESDDDERDIKYAVSASNKSSALSSSSSSATSSSREP